MNQDSRDTIKQAAEDVGRGLDTERRGIPSDVPAGTGEAAKALKIFPAIVTLPLKIMERIGKYPVFVRTELQDGYAC